MRATPRRHADVNVNVDVDVDTHRLELMSGLSLALGGANLIMQLSRAPIGHGVIESSVESGALHRHPVKRTRTTLSYIVIALFGTDDERRTMRREVDRQHRTVRSNVESAVAYSAYDPELQLWVAACMYRGLEDAVRFLHGPASAATLDSLYRRCASFATTLQVPASKWPADRAAFDVYWEEGLDLVSIDKTTRPLLHAIASLRFLPAPISSTLGPLHRFITTGFLPRRFREELELSWSDRHERVFDRTLRLLAMINRILPRVLREFPLNAVLWDTRRRMKAGRPTV